MALSQKVNATRNGRVVAQIRVVGDDPALMICQNHLDRIAYRNALRGAYEIDANRIDSVMATGPTRIQVGGFANGSSVEIVGDSGLVRYVRESLLDSQWFGFGAWPNLTTLYPAPRL